MFDLTSEGDPLLRRHPQKSLSQTEANALVCLLVGWLVCLLVCLFVCLLVGWLVGLFVGLFVCLLVGLLVGWFVCLLVGLFVGLFVRWFVYWFVCWIVCWLIGWIVGWLVGWVVGWLGGLLFGCLLCCFALLCFGVLVCLAVCVYGAFGQQGVLWGLKFRWFPRSSRPVVAWRSRKQPVGRNRWMGATGGCLCFPTIPKFLRLALLPKRRQQTNIVLWIPKDYLAFYGHQPGLPGPSNRCF